MSAENRCYLTYHLAGYKDLSFTSHRVQFSVSTPCAVIVIADNCFANIIVSSILIFQFNGLCCSSLIFLFHFYILIELILRTVCLSLPHWLCYGWNCVSKKRYVSVLTPVCWNGTLFTSRAFEYVVR